jgi:hypothetical protein
MTAQAWTRRLALCATLAAPLALAACDSDVQPRSFARPDFTYLTKLHLNVAAIVIDPNDPRPHDDDLATFAPYRPADVLRAMARDRLVADGSSGQAIFRVEEASIVPQDDKLLGTMDVQLEVATSDGSKTGYAEARVSRTIDDDDSGPNAQRVVLDRLINQMMTDMNVEFEYQLRKSLHDYMQVGNNPPPVMTAPVQTETLAPNLTPTPYPSQVQPPPNPPVTQPTLTPYPSAPPSYPPPSSAYPSSQPQPFAPTPLPPPQSP